MCCGCGLLRPMDVDVDVFGPGLMNTVVAVSDWV